MEESKPQDPAAGQIIIDDEGGHHGHGHVSIIGPRPVYFQMSNVNGPIVGGPTKEKEELKFLLSLARDRLKAYINGK